MLALFVTCVMTSLWYLPVDKIYYQELFLIRNNQMIVEQVASW